MQNSRLRENNPQSKGNIKTLPDKQKEIIRTQQICTKRKQEKFSSRRKKDPRDKHRSKSKNEE